MSLYNNIFLEIVNADSIEAIDKIIEDTNALKDMSSEMKMQLEIIASMQKRILYMKGTISIQEKNIQLHKDMAKKLLQVAHKHNKLTGVVLEDN